jgi:hypothetical protein
MSPARHTDHVAYEDDGTYSYGDRFDDLDEYLRDLQPAGWPVDHVVEAVCKACGGREFRLRVEDGGHHAERTCIACGTSAFIAGSGEYWMDEAAEPVVCPCGNDTFAIAVAYSMYQDQENVRAVAVGVRCLRNRVLGAPSEWNNRDHPSRHLLDQA